MRLRERLRRLFASRPPEPPTEVPPVSAHDPVELATEAFPEQAASISPQRIPRAPEAPESKSRPTAPTKRASRATSASRSAPTKTRPKKPRITPQTGPSKKPGRTSAPKRPPLETRELEKLLQRPPRFQPGVARSEDPESVPNDGYRLLDALRDKVGGLLLLTATPMQLHEYELYSMIELVEPGLFNGYSDFEASRADVAAINRAVTTLRAERPSREALGECIALLREHDAPEELLEAAAGARGEREFAAQWLSRCHRLSEALVRNRKTEIGGFTKRIAHRIDVIPGNPEVELERDVAKYIRERYAAAASGKQTAVGLVLVAFQKMLCSSSQALASALESRAARLTRTVEDEKLTVSDDPEVVDQHARLRELPSDDARGEADTLARLAARARRIDDAKLAALETLVDDILARDPDEKVLIFSQFLGTIEMIRARLASKHVVRVFHGGMSRDEKDQAHQAFRSGTRVLISSEAGGEGRNFQFCHVVVNYDLPWNPMKIEQRIGRIDRVGQTRDVEIYNFAVRGLLDERILDVLENRIRVFTETVGALDPILESFEEQVSHIALGDEGDVGDAFDRMDADLEVEIEQARKLEERRRDFVLDWRSLQRDYAGRLLGRVPRASREDLERFCRAAVERFAGAGQFSPHPEGGVLIKVPGVLQKKRNGVEEDYRGSFDVHEALRDERMQFFAMGHPLVEATIDSAGDLWWLPVTVFEAPDWTSDENALLVDYRLELFGLRDSGALISHVVTRDGIHPPVGVLQPEDPSLRVAIPKWPADVVQVLAATSQEAARREALARFEDFKSDHAALVEQELLRLARMYDSRRIFLDDRIARNQREVARLEASGTAAQRRIIPARQGQIAADRKRLAEIEDERRERVEAVQVTIPSHRLRLLGVAIIVPPGKLKEMAA